LRFPSKVTVANIQNLPALAEFRRTMEIEQRIRKRAAAIAEARGRIQLMLIMLSRYEPRYEAVLASLEDQWRAG
jgi:hypothetical protein